jgi:RNA polymerase sigma-70 factor, ECF subfamily
MFSIYYVVDKMDEQQTIQRLKDGDIGGLETLVAQYQVKAVRTAYLITGDPDLAEDIVQDAFVNVFRSIRGFDATRPFEPWFMRSVTNASLKVLQKSTRHVQIGEETEETVLLKLVERSASIEDQVESIEVQNQLWDAMQQLSPRQRAVIVQRYYLQMSEIEMMRDSGSAAGTIKWLLNAARERLRYLLLRNNL